MRPWEGLLYSASTDAESLPVAPVKPVPPVKPVSPVEPVHPVKPVSPVQKHVAVKFVASQIASCYMKVHCICSMICCRTAHSNGLAHTPVNPVKPVSPVKAVLPVKPVDPALQIQTLSARLNCVSYITDTNA